MEFNENSFTNKVALTCHTIVNIVLFLAYTLEWVKGNRTFGYYLIIVALTIIPLIAEWIIYKRDSASPIIRHVMGFTYSTLYIFAIFTTTSLLTFVYAIPMFIAITIYSDVKYGGVISVGGVVANVAYIVYYAVAVGYKPEEIPDMEIRIACVTLISLFMFMTTRANKRIGMERKKKVDEQQSKIKDLLQNVLSASDGMTEDISSVAAKMQLLGGSVNRIQEAMGEVTQGSNETAESIQTQLYQTEKIQNHISTVKNGADSIEKYMTETADAVAEGKKQMVHLAEQAEKSMGANSQVIAKMDELNEYTRQMNTIIETITSIANSTGMLALNASIEAARAGEAGRGFAVVADEISTLANQTKSATVDITNLIDNIHKELVNVTDAVDVVTQNMNENVESTKLVTEHFAAIEQGASKVKTEVVELEETVSELEKANGDIVEKIQTISAITEEVSAHSNETLIDCTQNSEMVSEIGEIVVRLDQNAQRLQDMR